MAGLSNMTTGIGESISSAQKSISSLTDNFSISNLSSLFSSKLTGIISKPSPTPAKIAKVSKTAFELSPFAEKVLIDPYKTYDLAKLTQSELAIDSVINYLESLLPPDILSELNDLSELANTLMSKGLSLESFIIDLQNLIPSNFSLTSLLRNVGVLDVYNYYAHLANASDKLGIDLTQAPQRFLNKGMSNLSSMRTTFGVLPIDRRGRTLTQFGNNTAYISPVASTAVSLAYIDSLASTHVSTTSVLKGVGITNSKAVTVLRPLSSNQAGALLAGNKLLPINTPKQVITDINTNGDVVYGTISTSVHTAIVDNTGVIADTTVAGVNVINIISIGNSDNIKAMVLADSINTNIVATSIDNLGVISVDILNMAIGTHTLIVTQTIVQSIYSSINALNMGKVLKALAEIKIQGTVTWVANNTMPGDFTDLVMNIDTYGLELVTIIANAINGVGIDTVVAAIDAIATLGSTYTNALISTATLNTLDTVTNAISVIEAIAPPQYTIIKNQAVLHGIATIAGIINSKVSLSKADLAKYIEAVNSTDTALLLQLLPEFNNISATNITTIIDHLAENEPYSILDSNEDITGAYLHYAVKKGCEIAAENGNYQMVKTLIADYPGIISANTKKGLISSILRNYTITEDDIAIGFKDAAASLVETLNSLYPDWLIDTRGNDTVGSLQSILTASTDSLKLLQQYPVTSVEATLQLNNHYTR